MKAFSLLLVSVALLCLSPMEPPVANSAKGIQFQNITFQKALNEAKQQHKFVFLNAYAVWCGPCKALKQTTFQSVKVADLINHKCIPIDVDVEKGEGVALAKKYQIQAHPLMLILNSKGQVVKRILGYMDESQFLQEIDGVLK